MTVGILQPSYLPWLGFFEQIYRSDVFVIYDDVQYDKNGWRNRNQIKTSQGVIWLTVPVHVKNFPLIKEVRIDNSKNWQKKHLSAIKQNYSKAPYFRDYFSLLEEVINQEWTFLAELDIMLINHLAGVLGIKTPIRRSSELGIEGGNRIERLINICRHFQADIFYEGAAGRNYINEADFEKAGIKVLFQDYRHPVYRQLYGSFRPYLSVIDLIFNEGPKSLDILTHKKI